MLKILKPLLIRFLSTTACKQLVIDLLRVFVKQTSNNLDDQAVDFLEKQLFPTRKISSLPD
tara:strand:- start:3732 stop:3914 length:183 start_codon:yes stop_codon:yes gene_type:complete